MHLAEYRKRPALLADWLPWAGLVAPGVVLNKDGSFQRTARFRGPDLDSATQGELVATSARQSHQESSGEDAKPESGLRRNEILKLDHQGWVPHATGEVVARDSQVGEVRP